MGAGLTFLHQPIEYTPTGLEGPPETTLSNSPRTPRLRPIGPSVSSSTHLLHVCSRLPFPQLYLTLPPAVALSALQVPAPCAPWQKEGRGPFGISSETLQLGDWRKQSAESLEERQKRVTVFLPTESPLHTPSWHPTACGGMSPRLPHSMLPPRPRQHGWTQEPRRILPSQGKTGLWSSHPIHGYLRHFPPLPPAPTPARATSFRL